MVKRTSHLPTIAQLGRGWPHQVGLPDMDCTGEAYVAHREFAASLGDFRTGEVSAIGPGHGVETLRLYCFTDVAHADAFMTHFGGIRFDPAWRGKGKKRNRWWRD